MEVVLNRQQRRQARKQGGSPTQAGRAKHGTTQLSAEQAFIRAGQLIKAGKAGEAQAVCRAALVADPDHAYSLLLGGILALGAGRKDEAQTLLLRATRHEDRQPDYHNNLGNALIDVGQFAAARVQFERAARLAPDNAQLHYNLANLTAALGEPGAAQAAFERALAIAPAYLEARINLGNLFAQRGRTVEAAAQFEAAIAHHPDSPEAHNNLGFLLNEAGRHDEAVAHFERALAIKPKYAHAHNNLGNARLALGAFEDAARCYKAALALDPRYVNAINNLSNAQCALGQFDAALTTIERAVAIEPEAAEIRNSRGSVLHKLGRFDEAVAEYERAVKSRPDYADAWSNLATVNNDLGRHDRALVCSERAIALDSRNAAAHGSRGIALVALRRFDAAMESYQRALALNPDNGDCYCNIGSALVELGRIDEALGYFDRAIAVEPDRPKFHLCHVLSKRVARNDPRLERLEALARDEAKLAPEARIDLRFALAKAYDDTGRREDAFRELLIGNALKRATVPYDERVTLGNLDRLGRAWTREAADGWRGMGHSSALPVFIVGMPRSGSTLVEQILASHPAMTARGELNIFHDAASAALGPLERFDPVHDHASDRGPVLARIADAYLRALGPVPPGVERAIDKTPGNFAFVPLIGAALPNARIIHTRRDPLDTCLSCFAGLFASVAFSHDLGELGRYYRAYAAMMDRWRAVLPQSAFLDVDYETLVSDFENQARRIIAYCGLPWDERCLSFHKTDRPVKTASAIQVRQPLYASSVGRARGIDPALLAPLRAALAG